MRGTESYSCLQSLAVVLEMNDLIADPYIDMEGRQRLEETTRYV